VEDVLGKLKPLETPNPAPGSLFPGWVNHVHWGRTISTSIQGLNDMGSRSEDRFITLKEFHLLSEGLLSQADARIRASEDRLTKSMMENIHAHDFNKKRNKRILQGLWAPPMPDKENK
jgi:hypothetical protein